MGEWVGAYWELHFDEIIQGLRIYVRMRIYKVVSIRDQRNYFPTRSIYVTRSDNLDAFQRSKAALDASSIKEPERHFHSIFALEKENTDLDEN